MDYGEWCQDVRIKYGCSAIEKVTYRGRCCGTTSPNSCISPSVRKPGIDVFRLQVLKVGMGHMRGLDRWIEVLPM